MIRLWIFYGYFNLYISFTISHLLKMYCIIAKSFLPVNARKLFVNSYILPHIDYCCVIWGNCSITLVHSLEKLLKKSARLILDEVLDRQNTTPSHVLYTNLRWMSIPERINYHRAVQV